jgi:hypothetical protein
MAQLSCWQLCRTLTGRLRAHPYPPYQREPGSLHVACTRAGAKFLAALAQTRGRGPRILSVELQRVARELDDARALTWSKELSDAFGRTQTQLRSLLMELDSGVRNEPQLHHEPVVQEEAPAVQSWPYLAL